MPTLNASQLEYLRRDRQRTKLYLSIFQPASLGYATIAEHLRGARQLVINNFTGVFADILPGMTALIGTSNGDDSYGRVRIKSYQGTPFPAINIAENAIMFPAGAYVTIMKDWQLWPIFPRVEANGDLEVWQDYDIEYTDQNTKPDPIPIMGCAAAEAMFLGGSVSLYFDWSSSYSPADGVTIVSYAATFDGGTPNTSTAAIPGYVAWTVPGSYWVHLTVTDSNGKSFTGRRQVVIHDPTQVPIVNFELISLSGDWSRGGWQAQLRLHNPMPLTLFRDRTFIIIWREDFNGGEQREIGRLAGREHIIFTGWVDGESIVRRPRHNFTELTALGTVPFIEKLSAFPVTLEHNPSPSEWRHIHRPTLNKAVRFYLRWNTTALTLADFYPCTDTKLAKYLDFAQENVTAAIRSLTEGTVFANFLSDQYGRMFVDVNAQMHTGTITYTLDTSDADWREEEVFVRDGRLRTAWAELSGVYFDGGVDEPTPVISQAPGEAIFEEGSREVVGNLITPDQAGLNQLAGMYLAWKNNLYPDIRLPMAGNWANAFDIVPQETIRISLSGNETHRAIVWNNKEHIVRTVEHKYDYRTGNTLTDLGCEARTVGIPGVPGNYPDTPPPPPPCDDCPPPCVPCTPCDPAYPCQPPPENNWRSKVYVSTLKYGILHTHDFSGPSVDQPTWTRINTGLPIISGQIIVIRMIGDPYDPHRRQWCIASDDGILKVYRSYWETVESHNWEMIGSSNDLAELVRIENDWSETHGPVVSDIHANINSQGYIAAVVRADWRGGVGAGIHRYIVYSNDYGSTWNVGGRVRSNVEQGQNRRMEIADCGGSSGMWVPDYTIGGNTYLNFSALGGLGSFSPISEEQPEAGFWANSDVYVDPSAPSRVWAIKDSSSSSTIYRSIDFGGTWEAVLTLTSPDGLAGWHSLQLTFTNTSCGSGPCNLVRVISHTARLYYSMQYGDAGTWVGPIPADPSGAVPSYPGISLIHDSNKFLYCISQHDSPVDHRVAVTEHDYTQAPPANIVWYGKAGVDRTSTSTNGIPTDAIITDILEVWTED